MNYSFQGPPFRDTISIAGWLFADLLLALAMIFLVSNSIIIKGNPFVIQALTPTNTPTFTPTLTLIPTATGTQIPSTPTQSVLGLSAPQCYNIFLKSTEINEINILNKLSGVLPNNENTRAGLVLIWSHGRDVGEGVEISREVGATLREIFPLSFTNAPMKSLYFIVGPEYMVQLEIYFFTNSSWASGFEVPCSYNN